MPRPWYLEAYQYPVNFPEPSAHITGRQVDFMEKEIGYDRSRLVLDVGCGAGRHSLELARRGYQVTGVDLSEAQLAKARAQASAENLSVDFICRDARALNFYQHFHFALLMCSGAFSLMETDEMDWLILRNVASALLPGSRFVITVPNAAYMLTHCAAQGNFDPLTFRETFLLDVTRADGTHSRLECSRRHYTIPEMRWLLRQSGFQKINFFAVQNDQFDLSTPPGIDHCEFGVIADK